MTNIIEQTFNKNKRNKNHSHRLNRSADKWGINLGNIKTRHPLNCGECGSKNLKFYKGTGRHKIKAVCQNQDCNHTFWVAANLAAFLEHLVEPDPPPETRVCRYCGKPATVVDEHYYQCRNCGDRLVQFNFGGEIDE